MNRRGILRAVGGLLGATAIPAAAQPREKLQTVGLLLTSVGPDEPLLRVLRRSLGELGYIEGKNIRFEFRSAYGKLDRLPALAKELAQINVDVIVAGPDPAVVAAKRTVSTVPIVMLMLHTDPVTSGVVQSFSRPGGNVTGIYGRQPELVAKRLELLREVLPALSRIGVLYDATGAGDLADLHSAARELKIELVHVELKQPYDLEAAFNLALKANVAALMILYSVPSFTRREEFARAALKRRLPTMAFYPEFPRSGGLMSYGIEAEAAFRRAAYFVDRVLKGVSPSDLPVEQLATFRLVLNLRTAKALDISFPQSILLRADEVIQ